MIVTFLGHRSLYSVAGLSDIIEKTICENIKFNDKIVFYCGGYGDFDNLCAKICRSIKRTYSNCEIVFITPYLNKSQQKKMNNYLIDKIYDSIIYPQLENVPPKFAISRRNEWMVDQSDLIIAYVEHTFGGAYKSLCYAQRKKKRIINLAECNK